jgi:hypothetical protein
MRTLRPRNPKSRGRADMRAEIAAIAAEIKQSLELLRRHL